MELKGLERKIGKYTVLDVIGSGGMGIVYRAQDPTIGRTVAIKMLRPSVGDQHDLLERFFSRETRSTGNLQHKNIVTIYDSGEQDGNPFLVMEYLEGEPVSKLIAERTPVPVVRKLELIIQVSEGLHYAHDRNVIHRDIKPANVIVLKDGTAKIVDFGIARLVGSESSIVQAGQLMGSPLYMSPEQINGNPLDGRTDIFSTGVMLYELLTFVQPFRAEDAGATFVKILREDPPPLYTFSDEYPRELDECVSRALAKEPKNRYQTADEFGFDLLQIQKQIKQAMKADFLHRAEAAMERGDLERVKLEVREILYLDRQDERANQLLGEVRRAVQRQQRSDQIVQLRSQAQVALAGRQYEEALACADQCLRLDPEDQASRALREELLEAIARVKTVRDSLHQAEVAFYAGNLDEAKQAVEEALRLDQDNAEARILASLVARELAERSRRLQVKGLVDQGRREISERKFTPALDVLRKAEQLDPSASNIRELIQWAHRGSQQEQRRKELQEIMDQIEAALSREEFSSACTICQVGLGRFPEESSLLRLKSIAQKQAAMADRRRFVQEQSIAIRALLEKAQYKKAVDLLTSALQKYPGERNLEALLAHTRAKIEGRDEEEDTKAPAQRIQREGSEASQRARQSLLKNAAALKRLLDAHEDLQPISEAADSIRKVLATVIVDEQIRSECHDLLEEAEARGVACEWASVDLQQLRSAAEGYADTDLISEVEERIGLIREKFPNETSIQHSCVAIESILKRRSEERDRVIDELTSILDSIQTIPPDQLSTLSVRAAEIAGAFAPAAAVGLLLQQITQEAETRANNRRHILEEIERLCRDIEQTRSLAELGPLLKRGQAVASSETADVEISVALGRLQEAISLRGHSLEAGIREAQRYCLKASEATTIEKAEEILAQALKHAADLKDNSDVQQLVARLTTEVQGRRVRHDLDLQELTGLQAEVARAESDPELASIWRRVEEHRVTHISETEIASLCDETKTFIQSRVRSLAEVNREVRPETSHKNTSGAVEGSARSGIGRPTTADAELVVQELQRTRAWSAIKATTRWPRSWKVAIPVAALIAICLSGLLWWKNRKPTRTDFARLIVTTAPGGVSIRVLGTNQECVTPQCTLSVQPGHYLLEARLLGYEDAARDVLVSAGGTESVVISMNRLPITPAPTPSSTGKVVVNQEPPARIQIKGGPPGAEVFVDGRVQGRINPRGTFDAVIAPGDHHIRLASASQESNIITQRFTRGAATVLNNIQFKASTPPPPAEQADWQQIKDSRNPADLERFLKAHPDGSFRVQADARLEDLYWAKTGDGANLSALRDYLNRYPGGKYSTSAIADVARLEWQALETSKDTVQLDDYLKKYPSGEYHDKAHSKLDELVWEHTGRGEDVSSLRDYVQRFPNGKHSQEAKEDIERLKETAAASANPPVPKAPAVNVPVADESAAVRSVLSKYQKAYEERDVSALRQIWPGLSGRKIKDLQTFFDTASSVKAECNIIGKPDVGANAATIKFFQEISYSQDGHPRKVPSTKVTMKLKRVRGGSGQGNWQIDSIQ